jgi:hypothetical protein
MDKPITINVTFGQLIDAGCWKEYCDAMGYNYYIVHEGLADEDRETTITLEQAKEWGLLN